VLLLKKNPWGSTLSVVLLFKATLFGAALIAMLVLRHAQACRWNRVTSSLFVVIILAVWSDFLDVTQHP
jgi:hypothetical protein